MTAPDPGLTDLKQILLRKIQSDREPVGWSMPDVPMVERIAEALREMATAATKADGQLWGAFPNTMTISDLAAPLALVVEQHTNGRIAEYIKQLESERETLTSMCSELESIRDEQAARIAELETLQRVDQDLFVQTLAIANQRKERAEKAEATVARVITALEAAEKSVPDDWGVTYIYTSQLRAALEGEQQ